MSEFFPGLGRPAAPVYLALVYEATAFARVTDDIPGGRGPVWEIWIAERAVDPLVGRQVQERHVKRLLQRGRIRTTSIELLRPYEVFALRPETDIWPQLCTLCALCGKTGVSLKCGKCSRTWYCSQSCREM